MTLKKAQSLKGIMAAEDALHREDNKWREEAIEMLEEDDPMRASAQQQQSALGDLASLPPGHPILVSLEEAKIRYEYEKEMEAQQEAEAEAKADDREAAQVRKTKKLNARKAKQDARIRQEEQTSVRRAAVSSINSSLVQTSESIKVLQENTIAAQQDFVDDMYAMRKLKRLERTLIAVQRALAESRLSEGIVTNV